LDAPLHGLLSLPLAGLVDGPDVVFGASLGNDFIAGRSMLANIVRRQLSSFWKGRALRRSSSSAIAALRSSRRACPSPIVRGLLGARRSERQGYAPACCD
jgi:hypothetical protein